MKKLTQYQKRYIWNLKKATREIVAHHNIHIWAAESEAYKPVQRGLSAKHLIPMMNVEDFKNVFVNKHIHVTTEMSGDSLMSSLRSIMGYNK